jgi:hypothetical protein
LEIIEVKAGAAIILVTTGELALLANALNEARQEIEAWEFATRLGVSVDEAEKLREQIVGVLDGLR